MSRPYSVTRADKEILRMIAAKTLYQRWLDDAIPIEEETFETAPSYGMDQPDPAEGPTGDEP